MFASSSTGEPTSTYLHPPTPPPSPGLAACNRKYPPPSPRPAAAAPGQAQILNEITNCELRWLVNSIQLEECGDKTRIQQHLTMTQ